MQIFFIIMIPFIGTALGAAAVFFLKNKKGKNTTAVLLSLASGVMLAASLFSLLIPSIEMAEQNGQIKFVPATLGFLLGTLFLIGVNATAAVIQEKIGKKNGRPISKNAMLILAITIHNIPEGMAVGVACAGAFRQNALISVASALSLSASIALQNLPEGAVVSLPLAAKDGKKAYAFLLGALSGAVEPIAAAVTVLFVSMLSPLLPLFLAFAAGAMVFVVVKELVPEAQKSSCGDLCALFCALGFALMMFLDVFFS